MTRPSPSYRVADRPAADQPALDPQAAIHCVTLLPIARRGPLGLAGGAVAILAFAAGLALSLAVAPAGPVATAATFDPEGAMQAQAGPSANRVYVPALSFRSVVPDCRSTLSVISLGPEAAKAILVLWQYPDIGGAGCQAPFRVICSGLLRPAGAWDFTLDAVDSAAASGVLYSLTARRLSEIGVTGGPDEVVADHVCDALTASVAGNCAAYSAFAAAFASGATHFGVPMDRAAGGPLAAEVHRACPADATPALAVTSMYPGTGAHALGARDESFGGYRYHAAPIHADHVGLTSTLYVQNAGADPANVELWLEASGACDGGQLCRTLAVDPGASAIISADDCVDPEFRGSAWLRSSAPLAVAIDTTGQDTLATYSATAPAAATDPWGAPAITPQSHAAYGPLVYDAASGWEAEVTVQNLSLVAGAEVTVTFLDAGGAVTASQAASICPRGSAAFLLPVADDRPGGRTGSVRVVSRAPGGAPSAEPVPIGAVVTLREYNDAARTRNIAALAYNLVPESAAFAWPAGAGSGGTASGSAIVAVPALWKDLGSEDSVTMELAITNLVPQAGWTDMAVLLYDQNALVDVLCRRLSAGQTTYMDLQKFGAVPVGFRGSAVISASFWEHPVPADAAGPARQLVGLGAVAVRRTGTRRGEDIPGDEIAGAVGVPLRTWPDAAGLPPDPCGTTPGQGRKPASGGHWQSVVPIYADKAGYNSILTIRNEGDHPTTVRLYFKALGDCLRDRICTLETLAAGARASFAATDCAGPDWSGSVALHSRDPLTVGAETIGRDPVISASGRLGRLPFDVNADAKVDAADRAVVVAAEGKGPGDPGWNARADLDASGRVDAEDLDWMERSLCGADRPPDAPALDLRPVRASQVLLPVLHFLGDDNICDAAVTAQNIGGEPIKPLLVTWGAPVSDGSCNGPLKVACGGLVRPGGTWTFPTADQPSAAKSGLLFSFNMRPLSELGATVGGDEPAADYLCRTLAQTLVGDCDAYRRFKAAFDAGTTFAGVPLGKAAGSAVAAEVRRECPGDVSPGVGVNTAYTGIGAHEIGATDPALGAYLYYVPLIYANKAGFNTLIYAQNGGAAAASVKLWFQAQDDCSRGRLCTTLTVGPGETVSIEPTGGGFGSPTQCVGPDWQGNAWLESDQPLGVVIDIFGRDVLMTYRGVAPELAFDANGAPLPAGGRTEAYGPLYFSPDTGWDTGIQVQNLSRTRPAQVRVEYLDELGAVVEVLDDLICAAGSQTFFLPVENALPEQRVGSVRVVSQRLEGDPSVTPAPIAAIATMLRYSDPARTQTVAAVAYVLQFERAALARSRGEAAGTAAGVGAIVLTWLAKDGGDDGVTSALAISNFVHAPGWTKVAVLFYDANGLVDIACRRVDAGAMAYLDLAALPLADGFRGGAIVSATEWRHPVGGTGHGPLRNLVGLGAVVVTRRTSAAGDELSVAEGLPLAQMPAAPSGDALARCAVIPTATPTPTASITPTRTPTSTSRPPSPTVTRSPTPRTPSPTATPRGEIRIFLPFAQNG